MYVYVYIYAYVCTCICTCMCISVCIYLYIRTYMRTYIHTYITYTHLEGRQSGKKRRIQPDMSHDVSGNNSPSALPSPSGIGASPHAKKPSASCLKQADRPSRSDSNPSLRHKKVSLLLEPGKGSVEDKTDATSSSTSKKQASPKVTKHKAPESESANGAGASAAKNAKTSPDARSNSISRVSAAHGKKPVKSAHNGQNKRNGEEPDSVYGDEGDATLRSNKTTPVKDPARAGLSPPSSSSAVTGAHARGDDQDDDLRDAYLHVSGDAGLSNGRTVNSLLDMALDEPVDEGDGAESDLKAGAHVPRSGALPVTDNSTSESESVTVSVSVAADQNRDAQADVPAGNTGPGISVRVAENNDREPGNEAAFNDDDNDNGDDGDDDDDTLYNEEDERTNKVIKLPEVETKSFEKV
jgi:hypothetical protein